MTDVSNNTAGGSTAIDDALERFAQTGPEFGPGLSNHGPMATDALIAMGRPDVVAGWAEWYAGRLTEQPESRHPIEPIAWREALGDIRRVGDWIAFFERELRERPWREVLDTWVARLAPGIMAGATHGILRTAHAVRTLSGGESPVRLHELAEGLGYWAARYQTLPETPALASGSTPIAQALAAVPMVPDDQRGGFLIFDAVRAVDRIDFAPVIDLVSTDRDVDAFVSDVTRTFVRQYLANADNAAIAFVHCVTAPSALRILAPQVSAATLRSAMRYAWQANAAIYATYGRRGTAVADFATNGVGDTSFDREDLIHRAVASRDEHAIKFTDACLREYAISRDHAFIVAAEDVVVRLRR